MADPVRGRPVDRRSDDYARSQALRCRRRHALDFLLPPRGPQFNNKPASVWIPMAFTDRQRQSRGNEFNHGVIGRLKDGVNRAHARVDRRSLGANQRQLLDCPTERELLDATTAPRDEVAGRTERPLCCC